MVIRRNENCEIIFDKYFSKNAPKGAFFFFLNLKKIGIDYDIREKIYHEIENLQLEDLTQFYHQEIKPISYNVAIMGKKENLDHSAIENLGDFHELSLEEIFGY